MSTFEEQFDQCRAKIAERMRICHVAGGFRVIELPTEAGGSLKAWPPTFQTWRAAELFLEEMLNLYVWCDPEEIYGPDGIGAENYEETARVWESLERQGVANPRDLARTFCEFRPNALARIPLLRN